MKSSATSTVTIPLNKPFIPDGTIGEIKKVLDSLKLSGDGSVCKAVEKRIEELFHVRHALLMTSCTHALESAARLLDLKPGDEVITPSFTFVSAANAIILAGGKPVFCDLNEETLTIGVQDCERKITKKTRAIMPMHYAGVSASMDDILDLASQHKLIVIEDAAQGVNAKYRGKFLGTIGDLGTYSFHDTKNIVSGEGGALLTNNEQFARKAEIIREKGTNRSNFLRGEVDKYTWMACGSSYVLSDILAAVLQEQLRLIKTIHQERLRVYKLYMNGLRDLEQQEKLRLPIIPKECESNYHIFYILLRTTEERNRVMHYLKTRGIGATFHYIPLHSAPFATNSLNTKHLQLPITDRCSSCLLRLPIYPQLKEEETVYIIEQLHNALTQ